MSAPKPPSWEGLTEIQQTRLYNLWCRWQAAVIVKSPRADEFRAAVVAFGPAGDDLVNWHPIYLTRPKDLERRNK